MHIFNIGEYVSHFGEKETGVRMFPMFMNYNEHSKHLLTADHSQNRPKCVKEYTLDGRFVSLFGSCLDVDPL